MFIIMSCVNSNFIYPRFRASAHRIEKKMLRRTK